MDKVIMKVFKSMWGCLPSLVLVLCIGRCLAGMPPPIYYVKDVSQALSGGMGAVEVRVQGWGAVPRLSSLLLDGYCADLKTRNILMYQKNCFTEEEVVVPVPAERHREPSHHRQSYPPLYYRPMNRMHMAPVCYYTYTWWYPQMVCHPFNPFYG